MPPDVRKGSALPLNRPISSAAMPPRERRLRPLCDPAGAAQPQEGDRRSGGAEPHRTSSGKAARSPRHSHNLPVGELGAALDILSWRLRLKLPTLPAWDFHLLHTKHTSTVHYSPSLLWPDAMIRCRLSGLFRRFSNLWWLERRTPGFRL